MRIFAPLPGEYVASALKRGNELLGIKSLKTEDFYIKPIPRVGFGISKTLSTVQAEWRPHQEFYYPKLLDDHKISELVLNDHTLYPMIAALGRHRATAIVTPKTWQKVCPDCVLEDLNNCGSPYIHCRHVLGSVQVCSTHACTLIETCPACSMPLKKHEIGHLAKCSKQGKWSRRQKREFGSTRHMYAKFVADLLGYRGPMIHDGTADFIAYASLMINRTREFERTELDISKLIYKEMGITSRLTTSSISTSDKFPMYVFLGCHTAENYLNLLANQDEQDLLREKKKSIFNKLLHEANRTSPYRHVSA
ncbi:hypothetical protein JRG49_00735 [Pseudomonas fulva]|uniref:TniQ family protein n=1 Tax=Pseudomonas TaxID=286 RepID=UPI000F7AF31D|nr:MULTISPECIES: TniQ family protein [Pseudomonas]MEE4910649.1 TniQ family protein [Pseudomonas alliivorans]MBA1191614.1 hypothetical protein [Pseudomonas entomophila]MBF8724745.1 hypothetical protein [Pseudomonas putida]MBN4164179.1 hypothetical protein [Pseudomonas fulva]MBN6789117.1 hypothetical protein [Pseudomonas fulva]